MAEASRAGVIVLLVCNRLYLYLVMCVCIDERHQKKFADPVKRMGDLKKDRKNTVQMILSLTLVPHYYFVKKDVIPDSIWSHTLCNIPFINSILLAAVIGVLSILPWYYIHSHAGLIHRFGQTNGILLPQVKLAGGTILFSHLLPNKRHCYTTNLGSKRLVSEEHKPRRFSNKPMQQST